MAPRTVDRGLKRQELIEAAARVFAARGFTDTRVATIAEQAGVGKGTLYEYFASKEELFFAVQEWINERIWERIQEVLAGSSSPRAQLESLFAISAGLVSEHLDVHVVTLDFWAASRGSDWGERFLHATRESYQRYRQLVADIVRRGQEAGEFRAEIDADALAVMLVGAIDGLGNQECFERDLHTRSATECFARVVLVGLCTDGE